MRHPLNTKRLRQPSCFRGPTLFQNVGNPEGARHSGRLFFGYFLLAKQKKATSRRATPGLVNESLLPATKSDAAQIASLTPPYKWRT